MSQFMRFWYLSHMCSHSLDIHAQLHSGPDICPEPLSTYMYISFVCKL